MEDIMKNKHLRLLVLLCILLMIFTGCTQAKTSPPDTSDSYESVEPNHEKMTLTVYLDSYTKEYMSNLIDQFLLENPDIQVIIEDYSDMIIPDYRTKLAGDLMAGEGPDIILASNTTNNTVQNLTKLLQNGAFLDLNELKLDLSSCNSSVLKAGIYNEKQYLIPLNYSLGFLLTTQERLEKYNIQPTQDLATFAASLETVYQAGDNAFLDIFTIEFLYRQNGLNLIDYKNNSLFHSENDMDTLQKISMTYTDLFPSVFEANTMKHYQFVNRLSDYNYSVEEAFLSEDLVFFSAPAFMGAYENLRFTNSICARILEMGQTPVLFTMPTIEGQCVSPCVNYFLLANGDTENKEAVKRFIDTALSLTSQYSVSSQFGIPVNNEVIEIMRDFYADGIVHEQYTFTDKCTFPSQITAAYFSAIDNMTDGVYIDVMSCGKLFSILREYATNGSDIENAYAIGKQQLELYLTE